MKAKTDVSIQMILQLFNNLLVQYEQAIGSNDKNFIKSSEKQLAYLVSVTNSLFAYGMPSANSRISSIQRSLGDMGDGLGDYV